MRARRRWRPSRLRRVAGALLALFVAAGCGKGTPAPRESAFQPLAVGDLVPAFTARTLDGDTVRLGGAQPVTLLNVWATWCTSCREEMADLEAIQRDFAGRGVRVVAVSVDAGDGQRVRRFVESAHLTFVVGHDPGQRVEQVYRTVGVPESFVISREGRLLWRRAGNLHDVVDSVRGTLTAALGGATAR